jgi:RNA polymerase sigma-70 factor (ECF subfamily)
LSTQRFEAIVREYGAALSRLAWGYASTHADHEDLLQDILLAIWRALPAFRGESSERTFVFRVAHNRAFTAARRRRVDEPLPEHAIADPAPLPDSQADERQRHELLMQAIRMLPELQREAVMLRLEDWSAQEIAELQGTTENNVNVRLARARARLRELLGALAE